MANQEIETKLPNLVQHILYLDDGFLAGTLQHLCTALNLLTNLGEGYGLELGIEKGELWSPVDLNNINYRVKRKGKEGFEILGAAIGNPSFVAASLRKNVIKIGKTSRQPGVSRRPTLCAWNSSKLFWCPKYCIIPAM